MKGTARFLVAFVCLIGLTGCSSGGGGEESGGEGDDTDQEGADNTSAPGATDVVVDVVSLGTSKAQSAFSDAYRSGLSSLGMQIPFSENLNCMSGGPVAVSGTVTDVSAADYSFDLSMTFSDCEGVDSLLRFTGAHVAGANQTSEVTIDFTGSLTASGCTVDFGNVIYLNRFSQGADAGTVLNGFLTAACSDATVSCTWSETSATDETAVGAGCTCSGNGC